jgi:signal transduction histidine kinase
MTDVSFKISSALKTIIGRELITDDFIAVFELVKNAFDANAREVEIRFRGLKTQTPSITIKDNGDGMDEDDLRNKWLFVAYSAKKLNHDYRDRIRKERVFAGSKGIGRFSCDRLGAILKLTTRKKGEDGAWHVLDVQWDLFEQDPKAEFQTIPANLSKTNRQPFPELKSGTILEISKLRSKEEWNRDKLLRLRRSLERLINPNQGNDANNFTIILNVPEEKDSDEILRKSKPDESWNIVNGPIKNFLFETLELKTTQIQLEIDPEGKYLLTNLSDRSTLIYELKEHNPFKDTLRDIRISLFFLNRAAKYAFSKRMGLRPVRYGSVFLYKNGFRIHPFGDVGDDSLGMDRRKQQRHFQYLGSRDLTGRIEINGPNPDFQETSSRDGGLIKNEAFDDLRKLFFDYALRRLENYAVSLFKYSTRGDFPELMAEKSTEQRKLTLDLITRLTQSDDVISVRYNDKILDILETSSTDSLVALVKNLKRIADEQNSAELNKVIARTERKINQLAKAKEEAEREAEKERARAEQAEQEAKESYARTQKAEEAARKAQEEAQESKDKAKDVSTQNLFLKSVLSKDLVNVLNLYHTIGQDAGTIEQSASTLLNLLKDGGKPLKPETLRAVLERISYAARKIKTVSRFATQANFRADAEEITADLTAYIREYLLNVYGGFVLDPYNQKVEIRFNPPTGKEFITQFTPIKVSIVLDNLLSNSRKHQSRMINVSVLDQTSDKLVISFKDDGKGISRKNISSLFQIGFSTTDGSGLGLYHSCSVMKEMNGIITFNEDSQQGAEFILAFKKQ